MSSILNIRKRKGIKLELRDPMSFSNKLIVLILSILTGLFISFLILVLSGVSRAWFVTWVLMPSE